MTRKISLRKSALGSDGLHRFFESIASKELHNEKHNIVGCVYIFIKHNIDYRSLGIVMRPVARWPKSETPKSF